MRIVLYILMKRLNGERRNNFMWMKEVFGTDKPVIGVLHMHAMPTDPKYDPVTGDYKGSVDLKKLGKYNYFKFVIYDIDAKGGYDTPAIYYFRL